MSLWEGCSLTMLCPFKDQKNKFNNQKTTAVIFIALLVFPIVGKGWLVFVRGAIPLNGITEGTNGRESLFNEVKACNQIETRGVWLNDYAFNSAQRRVETLEKIESANLNTIFLIAPPIAGNNGWSEAEDFVPMLSNATAKGLSVHAWVANMYRVKGTRADFLLEEEREAQKDWALALLEKYTQLDGIHFDYIRYHDLETINASKMNAILETLLLAKNAIKNNYPEKYLTCAGFPLSGSIHQEDDEIPGWFIQWFNNSSHDSVNRWKKEGYNGEGVPLPFRVQQDPVTWLNQQALDFHISMEYTYSTSWWCGEVDIWNTFPGNPTNNLFMGLGWYSGVWEEEGLPLEDVAEEIVNKINYGREHNIQGFSIFELGEPGNNDSIIINALAGEDGPFKEAAIPIFQDTDEKTNKLTGFPLSGIIFTLLAIKLLVVISKRPVIYPHQIQFRKKDP